MSLSGGGIASLRRVRAVVALVARPRYKRADQFATHCRWPRHDGGNAGCVPVPIPDGHMTKDGAQRGVRGVGPWLAGGLGVASVMFLTKATPRRGVESVLH